MDPKKTESFNPRAIFSKTGKGVQEASGKTSHLSRADRAVLSAIDGKTMLSDVSAKFEKLSADKFDALMHLLDKDGFIREVSSGQTSAPPPRPAAPAAKAPPKAAPPPAEEGDDMDFTQAVKIPPRGPAPAAPKGPPVDLAAMGRADAERKKQEEQATDFRTRQEAEAKAKAEAEQKARAAAEARAKAEAESRARAEAEAKARAEAEAKARAEAESKTRAEADAKVKAAREAAVRMATEAKAKAEAEAKAKSDAAERDKARLEAELNAKLDAERKAREEAEKRAVEAAAQAHKELEEKAKRLEAEMKAKLDAERRAREEEDKKRREEEDRRRKEEDERRAKEDAERRAREEADRKKREEEDRKRREEDERRRKEEDERRAREEADRKKQREEEERRRKEDDERRALEDTNRRLELDRRAKEDAERRAKEDAERRARDEAERKARAAADAAASLPKIEPVAPPPPPAAAPAASGGFGDSLLADLDSFGKREEEELKAKEEAERKAKEEAARKAKEDAERRAKEEAERKAKEEAERRAKEEAERRAKEEAERKEREEEERRKEEEAERKRKAKEAQAAKQAEERAAKAAAAKGAGKAGADDDIDVSEDDLDKDDLKRDQKVAAERARKAAREAPPVVVATGGRPKKWGKPAAIALFVLLLAGIAVLNLMPLSTAEYEKAASDAMGVPVKISSARLSALTGIEVKLEGVTVGGAKIRTVRGAPEIGSLFGARKAFSRIELEDLSLSQSQLADALFGKVAGENLRVGRITVKQLVMDGPLKLPPLDVDATVSGDGTLQTVKLTGPDKLVATLAPRGGEMSFEISAGSLAVPFVPALSLSEFAMKGTANRTGVVSSEFDGRAYDGVISGISRIRWGDSWAVEGELRVRTLKVAVFAPTLVSDGRIEGRAAYSMAGSTPGTLYESARLQGEFKIDKGVLGSFDIQRALQTGGNQSSGRTIFNEMAGQGLYDKGTVQFTNVTISAGAMNAGASLNIDAAGALSGRIVADVKTASQRQSATLNISGKLQDPVIRK